MQKQKEHRWFASTEALLMQRCIAALISSKRAVKIGNAPFFGEVFSKFREESFKVAGAPTTKIEG